MDSVELIRQCKGNMSLREFSKRLNLRVSRSHLGMILNGQRNPGPRVLRVIADAFPETREAIAGLFLPENVRNSEQPSSIENS